MVYKMGEVAEKALTISVNSFVSGKDRSEEVKELSDILLSMTVEAEEKAFELIAKYQPVASDLRIINSHMKIAYDLERFGRYAWDIASICKRFGGLQDCQEWIAPFFEEMGEKVLIMVRISIDSFKTHNAELAETISVTETRVDEMYFEFLDKLVEQAHETSECTISSVLGIRYLERIADHATYIAEAVVYVTTGRKTSLR